ncbi:hypothetical protein B0H16DRAFT_1742027 [Mycena metata]|uniref:Uncharacterized protein n=1 Tax=Mycena metata TaxID=1033252 RepID=A0AAD7HAD1_9AGAR|nr:hypothetical protein B0H16DRAFT_1742027 [Mycena metata]
MTAHPVVANNCDLEYERQVGMNEGRDLAKHFGCKHIESSAKLRTSPKAEKPGDARWMPPAR